MEVISVRVKKEIKEKILKYSNKVNWAEEIRKAIINKINELEAEENFDTVLEKLKKASWNVPKGFSANILREDRDSH
jgi:hypothetical protein